MNKLENLIEAAKLNEILGKKEEPKKKKCNPVVCVLAVVGAIAPLSQTDHLRQYLPISPVSSHRRRFVVQKLRRNFPYEPAHRIILSVLNLVKETRDYKVTVEFDKAGQKIMYASFAKLKRI